MKTRLILIAATLWLPTAAAAGPCGARITELETAITSKQEGAGPSLAPSASTAAPRTGAPESSGPAPANVAAESRSANAAMQDLQRAKRLDSEGKEAECMQLATQVGSYAYAEGRLARGGLIG